MKVAVLTAWKRRSRRVRSGKTRLPVGFSPFQQKTEQCAPPCGNIVSATVFPNFSWSINHRGNFPIESCKLKWIDQKCETSHVKSGTSHLENITVILYNLLSQVDTWLGLLHQQYLYFTWYCVMLHVCYVVFLILFTQFSVTLEVIISWLWRQAFVHRSRQKYTQWRVCEFISKL